MDKKLQNVLLSCLGILIVGLGVSIVVLALRKPTVNVNVSPNGNTGAATLTFTERGANAAGGDLDSATSTEAYWTNNTGKTAIIESITTFFNADDGVYQERLTPNVWFIATSTLTNATTTPTPPLMEWIVTTSTAPQILATSTLALPNKTGAASGTSPNTLTWQAIVPNGVNVIMGWEGGQGQASPGVATPSSTGAWTLKYFLK